MERKQTGMETSYFLENRNRFFEKLEDNTVVVLFSGTAQRKTADQYYPFEGNHNFFYLTGVEQEGSVLVVKKKNGRILKLQLCIRTADAYAERWYGLRMSRDEASKISGIYDISFSEGLDGLIKNMLDGWNGSVSIDKDAISGSDLWFSGFLEENYPEMTVQNIFPVFSQLRRIKSDYEVSLIRKAIEATWDGILQVFKTARVGMMEYELGAEFASVLAKLGLGTPSFDSIIATGSNFNYLHYPQLNTAIKKGDMILLDVGARFDGLCSDISRAFPIDGCFSEKQLLIYRIVRECQEMAFAMIKPRVYLRDINLACKNLAGERLVALGILHQPDEADQYYWHNVSHHLGLDVHDICSRDVILEEGMVLTVEPGVYVPEWNVGLRIEDNVLVTADGCEILSDCIPREPEEIEALLAGNIR